MIRKRRGEGASDACQILCVNIREAERDAVFERVLVFAQRQRTVERLYGAFRDRRELRHQRDRTVGAEPRLDRVKHVARIEHASGQHKMPDANAPKSDSVFVRLHKPDLVDHLRDRFDRRIEIVRCAGEFQRQPRIDVLEIGQINIHKTPIRFDRIDGFICVCIVHDGNAEPVVFCKPQRFDDRVAVRRRRDKVDVVRAERLKLQHGFRKAGDGEDFAELSVCQNHVLTKDALQIAAGEKDCAAAVRAADRRLLVKMQRRARDSHNGRTAAESGCGCSVDFAVSGADITCHQSNTRLPHTKLRYQ